MERYSAETYGKRNVGYRQILYPTIYFYTLTNKETCVIIILPTHLVSRQKQRGDKRRPEEKRMGPPVNLSKRGVGD